MAKTKPKFEGAVNREQNKKNLEKLPELAVFVSCYYGAEQLRKLRDKELRLSPKEQSDLRDIFEDTAEATCRFDVVCPVFEHFSGEIQIASVFWRWFNWWKDWMAVQSPARVQHIYALCEDRSPELEKFRPKYSWLKYRADRHF